jgi:hypothetical protein
MVWHPISVNKEWNGEGAGAARDRDKRMFAGKWKFQAQAALANSPGTCSTGKAARPSNCPAG